MNLDVEMKATTEKTENLKNRVIPEKTMMEKFIEIIGEERELQLLRRQNLCKKDMTKVLIFVVLILLFILLIKG